MRKLARVLVVGGLLAFTYPRAEARAAAQDVMVCGGITQGSPPYIPAECDTAGDPCAPCIATLLADGCKVTQAAGGDSAIQHLFVRTRN
jgi:hypothetical protein